MPADDTLEKPFVTEMIEAFGLPVALAAREYQGQIAWRAAFEKALLERDQKLIRGAVTSIARSGQHVLVLHDGNRVRCRYDFLQTHEI